MEGEAVLRAPSPGATGTARRLGALQVDTVAGVHPDPFTFADELGNLNRDPVAELGRLGAGGLGRGLHDGRGLHHLQLGHRRKLNRYRARAKPLDLEGQPRLQPLALVADSLLVEGILVVGARIHDVHPVPVPVEDLKLLGVEPGVFHEFRGAEPGIEGVTRVQVAEANLNERPQVSGGPVLEIHDSARLSVHHDHVAAPDIARLHRFAAPLSFDPRPRAGGSRTVEDTPPPSFLQTRQ
jgi:hypothetical protein